MGQMSLVAMRIRNRVRKKRNRSGKAVCPICKQAEFLVEHHFEGRDVLGWNRASNKADICDNCHRRVHEGVIVIEGWFMTSDGVQLIWHKKGEESFTGQEKVPYLIE